MIVGLYDKHVWHCHEARFKAPVTTYLFHPFYLQLTIAPRMLEGKIEFKYFWFLLWIGLGREHAEGLYEKPVTK